MPLEVMIETVRYCHERGIYDPGLAAAAFELVEEAERMAGTFAP